MRVGPLQTGAVLGRASGAASLVGAAGSPLGGCLIVEDAEDRVHIAGTAVVRARLTL
ncbi:hypothetical protein BVI434_420057 [Burkholderia vietnamiensis]|nr:hypothetical protein BVI434_420057 [Burkholderia vietnamiensis]